METTSEDKQILSRKVLRIFIRPGYGMYLFTRRYLSQKEQCITVEEFPTIDENQIQMRFHDDGPCTLSDEGTLNIDKLFDSPS
jgi:hypothetical protein